MDIFGRLQQQVMDADLAGLEVTLERGAPGPDLVRALERLHALDEGTLRGSRGGLGGRLRRWRHGRRVYSARSLRQGAGQVIHLDLKLRFNADHGVAKLTGVCRGFGRFTSTLWSVQ